MALNLRIPDQLALPHHDTLPHHDRLKFTIFGKLPTEMRLKIWRAYLCANPRYVDLEIQCLMYPDQRYPNVYWGDDAEYNQRIADIKAQFPQTLLVNRESRCETLKTFSFLFNYRGSGQPRRRCFLHRKEKQTQAEAEAGCHDIPIWINTKWDIVHLHLGGIFDEIRHNGPIAHIAKYAPEIFEKVQTLEVRGFEGSSNPHNTTKVPFVLFDSLQCLLGLVSLRTILLFDPSFGFRPQIIWKTEIDRWLTTPAGAQFKENGIKIMARG